MTPEEVISRLEEAGGTLLALRLSRVGPAYTKCAWPEVVHDSQEAYGYNTEPVRPAIPSADMIDRMDEALEWILLIPKDRYVIRRIVGARSLVNPRTQRHLFTWRRLALKIGADYRAVQRWHQQGVETIISALACPVAGGVL